jgi:thioredoxin 2
MSDARQVVCPHCHTIIRVPAVRLADQPKCAKCHQALFTGQPFELTAEYFDRHAERNDIPLLVDFWAEWCGPCQMMASAYAQAARTLEPRAHLAKVNTESQPSLAGRFGIHSIPTLALFHRGREIARQSGALTAERIVAWVQSNAPRA